MSERVILAIDLGTSGMKAALITAHGKVLGWEFEPIQLHLTPDGGAEQSPVEWWQAFLLTSKRLIHRDLIPSEAIQAVCCSTQGEGTVPVDRDGTPRMNCILWMDMRGAASLSKQFGGLLNVSGARLDKVANWIRLTGGMPSSTGKDPAGHMLFIRDMFPEIYEKTYKFLNVLDYLNLRLTGRFCATFDSILTSWVTDNRDPDRIRYHAGLVRQCGIDQDKLPEIVKCSEIIGVLKADIRDTLGLVGEIIIEATPQLESNPAHNTRRGRL
jgi:xylulokinase